MEILLYNNHSENNKVNKTIVLLAQLSGFLREQTSLINPQIMIEFNPQDYEGYVVDNNQVYITYMGNRITWDSYIYDYVLSANYVYIPNFNRFYFINDITSVRQNLWRLTLHVDVLMSYEVAIGNTKALVTRNEFTYDPMVKDDEISYYYDKEVVEITPDHTGSLINTTFDTGSHTKNCVLSCISFNAIPSATPINAPEGTNLPDISQIYYNEQFSETCFIMDINDLSVVSYRALNSDNLMSYVKSVIIYPFDLDQQGGDENTYIVYLGNTAIQKLTQGTEEYLYAHYLAYKVSKYYVTEDFILSGDNGFLDYDPYTKWELYLAYYGWITLSPDQVLNHRLIVYYTIQVEDGSANVYVYDVTGNKMIFTSTCQLGVRIGLSTTNNEEISASKKANNLNLTLGLLSSVASIGIGAYTGNGVAVVGGVLSGAKTITSYINNNSMMFEKAQATFGTGVSGMYSSQRAIIRKTMMKPKGYDQDYFRLKGKPLNKVERLGDLTGFTIVGEEHLEGFASATKPETEEINTLLKTGVIL